MTSSSVAPEPTVRILRIKNLAASIAIVGLAYAIYRVAPYNQRQLNALYGPTAAPFTGAGFLLTGSLLYMVALAIYFLAVREPRLSKSLRFFHVITAFVRSPAKFWRKGLVREDRLAVLTTLLKVFFGPMMAMALLNFCTSALLHGIGIAESGAFALGLGALFDRHGFWFLMQLILFVDVLIYTVGYLVELPRLDNEIRSVDRTLLGWAAALLCYPPFNQITSAILGSRSSDFPQFDNPTTHLVMNFSLLALMTIYTSASVALGFKASNLTHRGIVARGPYALVRHPAYTSKNLAWWIGAVPAVSAAFTQSLFDGIQAVASVAGLTMLYILRALTEEDHLRSVDGEYAAYAAKVRYRFVPGVV